MKPAGVRIQEPEFWTQNSGFWILGASFVILPPAGLILPSVFGREPLACWLLG
jgi:hypothetical protein